MFGQAVFALVDAGISNTDLGLVGYEVYPAEPSLEDVFVMLSRAQANQVPAARIARHKKVRKDRKSP